MQGNFPPDTSINMMITGDYCPIGRNVEAIKNGDSEKLFGDLFQVIQSTDFAVTNLECPIINEGQTIKKTGPNIKANTKSLEPLSHAGFDMVTLANNHIMDYGADGLKSTLKHCGKIGLHSVGAGATIQEARKPKIVEIKGKSFAFLNFAENEFCSAKENEYGANPVNIIQNHHDIKEARNKVDFLIIIAHGGREHFQLPTPLQRERYRFYIDSGADVVIGHHSHCVGGYEFYNDKLVFYSLGNFLFDYKKKYQKGTWTLGAALKLNFEQDKINFEIIPFHQGRLDDPNISLLQGDEKEQFLNKIETLRMTIENDIAYKIAWNAYIETQKKSYKGLLLLQNKYIRFLVSKGWLPSFFLHSKSHQRILLNLLRCETHREIMIDTLNESIQ